MLPLLTELEPIGANPLQVPAGILGILVDPHLEDECST